MLRWLLLLCCLLGASECLGARIVSTDESWHGKVVLDGDVTIPAGVTVTIQPGTELTCSANALLLVEGRLLAKGTAAQPIAFQPAQGVAVGGWQGLSFSNGPLEGSELEHVSIAGAAQAIAINGSKVRVATTVLRNGGKGIAAAGGGYLLAEGVTITEMSEGGIDASVGSQGRIVGCRLFSIAGYGIQIGKKAAMSIRDNQVADARFGILISGDFPPLEGNRLERCENGLAILQASPNSQARNNTILNCKVGIACRQFSAPLFAGNTIEGCEYGIECFQSASPLIRNNRLLRNQQAISAIQLCNPVVTHNDFLDNQTAIYLHLSSYAEIHDNNFDGNRLHIELDNMSYDWEVRAGRKPTRSRDKQNEILLQGNRPPTPVGSNHVESEGFVDARNNYWGKETTEEMERLGATANITAIRDAWDVPTRTYEGWEGEYLQDKVRYDGWKKERIAGTFVP